MKCVICNGESDKNVCSTCEPSFLNIKMRHLLKDEACRNEYYNIHTKKTVERLKSLWEEKGPKMRSDFKVKFIPSVIEYFNNNGYLSQKQVKIAENIIWPEGYCDMEDYKNFMKSVNDEQVEFIKNAAFVIDRKIIAETRKISHNSKETNVVDIMFGDLEKE